MYKFDKDSNRIQKIESPTFQELGFRERDHLPQWIASNTECLYEAASNTAKVI